MKTYFPYIYKKIGIAFVILAILLSITANINDFLDGFVEGYNSGNNTPEDVMEKVEISLITSNIQQILVWVSLFFSFGGFLLYMFSNEKTEDEFIQQLRYKSLGFSLLYTWIIVSLFYIFRIKYEIEGLYILQLQLIIYVVIYNYYKKWEKF